MNLYQSLTLAPYQASTSIWMYRANSCRLISIKQELINWNTNTLSVGHGNKLTEYKKTQVKKIISKEIKLYSIFPSKEYSKAKTQWDGLAWSFKFSDKIATEKLSSLVMGVYFWKKEHKKCSSIGLKGMEFGMK